GGFDTGGLQFTTAPIYYDYQGILDYPLFGGKFRAMLMGSDDELRFLFDQPATADPSLRGAFSTHILFHRLQLRWTNTSGPWSVYLQNSTGYNGSSGDLGGSRNFAADAFGTDFRLEARYNWSQNL